MYICFSDMPLVINYQLCELNNITFCLLLCLQQLISLNGGSFISGNVSKKYLEKSGNVYIA